MIVYLKQNEDYLPFLPGGKYEKWKAAEENPNRIVELHEHELPKEDEDNAATVAARATLLSKRQRDLATLLSIIARKVDQYDFDEVLNSSTSINSIWSMIELVYDIGRKGVHFLELGKIKYEHGDSPVKFYKKIYHHFLDNLYKAGDVVAYKGSQMSEDEKLSPTLLNFILYYTIESIDSRLLKKIKDRWGHVLDDDKCLHDLKDIILKAIPDLLTKLETKDVEANSANAELAAFTPRGGGRYSFRGRSRRGAASQRPWAGRRGNKFCRLCQASGCSPRIFKSHNVQDCTRWSRKDVEDLRVMILDMQVDPEEHPDSDSGQDQDQA